MILELIDELVLAGGTEKAAFRRLGVAQRSVQRWRSATVLDDLRCGPRADQRTRGARCASGCGAPAFKGMEKWEYKLKSTEGRNSVVHYIRDPATGVLADFKFKKRSTDTGGRYESMLEDGKR